MNRLLQSLFCGSAAVLCVLSLTSLREPAAADFILVKLDDTEQEPAEPAPADETPAQYTIRISTRPLLEAINDQRAENGSGSLSLNDTLMDIASQRIHELESYPAGGPLPVSSNQISSETLVRGYADPNTALSAILLNDRQKQNLVYDGYKEFGFAVNDSGSLWVFLMTS